MSTLMRGAAAMPCPPALLLGSTQLHERRGEPPQSHQQAAAIAAAASQAGTLLAEGVHGSTGAWQLHVQPANPGNKRAAGAQLNHLAVSLPDASQLVQVGVGPWVGASDAGRGSTLGGATCPRQRCGAAGGGASLHVLHAMCWHPAAHHYKSLLLAAGAARGFCATPLFTAAALIALLAIKPTPFMRTNLCRPSASSTTQS